MAGEIRVDAKDLLKVSKMAREFSPALKRELLKNLRAAGQVGADAAKESIQQMPSSGGDNRGLRNLIAAAVSVNTATTGKTASISIRVRRTAALEAIKAGGLAKAINTGNWSHPVFGNRKVWVKQTGVDFFEDKINAKKPEMLVLVKAAMDSAVAIVTKGV